MSLPGLRRAPAIAQLPALGLLTLAGQVPPSWTCSYSDAPAVHEGLVEQVAQVHPDLVAVLALAASITEAYRLGDEFRRGACIVIGGLSPSTPVPDEAAEHFDAVVVGEGEPGITQTCSPTSRPASFGEPIVPLTF